MRLEKLFPSEKDAKNREQDLRAAWIAFLCAYVCMLVGMSAFQTFFDWIAPAYASVASLFGAALAGIPLFFFFRSERAPMCCLRYLKKEKAVLRLILGWLLGLAMLFFLIAILFLLDAYAYAGAQTEGAVYMPLLFLSYLVQGSAEELLCRGVFMPILCVRYGGTVGAAVSAAFFALMHAMNPGVGVFALLNVFLFGLLFASVTQRAKSVWPVCGLHAGWNFSQSLFGLQVSGSASLSAPLRFESRISWLTGGAFGPEGSPILTFFLLLFLACPFMFSKKTENR